MKILLLNPHIDAGHNLFAAIDAKGIALLAPSSPEEAWQMLQLHGTSIDLAVIHKEGLNNPDEGIALVNKIKKDSEQHTLPLLISTSTWDDEACAKHQQTAEGANAYLHWPFTAEQFFEILEAMFDVFQPPSSTSQLTNDPNSDFPSSEPTTISPTRIVKSGMSLDPITSSHPIIATTNEHTSGFVLEDARNVLTEDSNSSGSFTLEAPDFPDLQSEATPPLSPIPHTLQPPPTHSPATFQRTSEGTTIDSQPALHLTMEGADLQPPQSQNHSIPDAEATRIDRLPLTLDSGSVPTQAPPPEIPATLAAPQTLEKEEEPHFDLTPETLQKGLGIHVSSEPAVEADDPALRQEMPYLFRKKPTEYPTAPPKHSMAYELPQPIGNAIIPGGAAHNPDLETLKKYLLLREQDVAALSTQLKETQQQVAVLENLLLEERTKTTELTNQVEDSQKRIENFEKEKTLAVESLEREISELKFQIKTKTDKTKLLESQVREATSEMERLKDRVRMDIRKIRVREKELENKLEIIRKDSEVLIGARENKIIELKRKLDLLEFNMDLLQNQYTKERELTAKLRERLAKAARVVRVAGGFLDTPASPDPAESESLDPDTAETDRKAS